MSLRSRPDEPPVQHLARGRNLTLAEAGLEAFAKSWFGYQYLLHLAPRIDRVLIPRTKGRWSSGGKDKIGLLTSTGAKTGKTSHQPLGAFDLDGDRLLLIASNYGRPVHPGWSANLIAHPECTFEFRSPQRPYVARLLEGSDREKAWELAVDSYTGYAMYERRCAPRRIRLFELTPT